MTTKVKMIHAGGNNAVQVSAVHPLDGQGEVQIGEQHTLTAEGDECELWVHSSAEIHIQEVALSDATNEA